MALKSFGLEADGPGVGEAVDFAGAMLSGATGQGKLIIDKRDGTWSPDCPVGYESRNGRLFAPVRQNNCRQQKKYSGCT